MTRLALISVGATLLLFTSWARSAEPAVADANATLAGHSAHGEAFNEGPRQKAYLMGGTGPVHLPITTTNAEAQAFFDQGVGQLHGFWYFEAERSFRQVAALDPKCAMAYWGMAMANVNNGARAKGFIRKAVERKANANRREQLWIDACSEYWLGKKSDKDRRGDLIHKLEDLSYEYPRELEAKAFLAFYLWDSNGKGWPYNSRLALDSLLKEILSVEPMHPVHHYRIHLWDGDKAVRALDSAARCGQSSPNIAHMWHMSGHIYAKLHRYADAAWQQEASARVDHRHMMRDRVLPDQIHNYAHNNQWLVEDLEYVGRARDAVALAKNLIELPRHPKYNTLGLKPDGTSESRNSGSSAQGRRRLFETLDRFELWDELIAQSSTMYLDPTELAGEQVKRLRALGVAYFSTGNAAKGAEQIQALEAMLPKDQAKLSTAKPAGTTDDKTKASPPGGRGRGGRTRGANQKPAIEEALVELRAYDSLARGDVGKAKEAFGKVKGISKERLALVYLQLGDKQQAEKLAREAMAGADQQVVPLANYVDVLNRCGKVDAAREQFLKLRLVAVDADLDVPVMRRLEPLVKRLGFGADWRAVKVAPNDVGNRPSLNSLGPVHWQPTAAPEWSLLDSQGRRVSLRDYHGRPVIVIFFLGSGCSHCIAQLNAFEPMVAQFEAAGISLVAVSTDSTDGLKTTFEKSKLPRDFTLVSDHDLKTFKAYRAYDDFENMPLHGTFLIDANGLVRWQDISYEPFQETGFLLKEAKRLMALPAIVAATEANGSRQAAKEQRIP